MTALNFMLAEEMVLLVTDTQMSDPEDMQPRSFITKVFVMPHWQGLICGTGIAQFIIDWCFTANTSIVARNFRHLDQFAPQVLNELFDRYLKHQQIQNPTRIPTSTIYHLGFDDDAGRFIGFAYRSTGNFKSEPLDDGFRFKPDPEEAVAAISNFPDDFISLTSLQKQKDEGKEVVNRVGIGGHLVAYMMERASNADSGFDVRTTVWRCHEFHDYELAYKAACLKLQGGATASFAEWLGNQVFPKQ